MRSRYAAYAKGFVDYILATTDPEGPQWQANRERWAKDVADFSANTRFEGLTVLEAPPADGNQGTVTFRVVLKRGGQDVGFVERSAFRRSEGRWLYVAGTPSTQ